MPVRLVYDPDRDDGRDDQSVRPVRSAVPPLDRSRKAQGLRDMIGGFADYGRALVNIFR